MFQWCLDSGIAPATPILVGMDPSAVSPRTVPSHARASFDEHTTLHDVEELATVLRNAEKRVTPDVITFNTLVEICAKSALHGGADLKVQDFQF